MVTHFKNGEVTETPIAEIDSITFYTVEEIPVPVGYPQQTRVHPDGAYPAMKNFRIWPQ